MTTHTIRDNDQLQGLIRLLSHRELPITVNICKGIKRSIEQNRLQRKWINAAAEQLDQSTPEELRGYCKLTFGVPILRLENEEFRRKYDENVRGLSYETQLAIMTTPLDMPVTRLMTTKQTKAYLDAIIRCFSELGVCLPIETQRNG